MRHTNLTDREELAYLAGFADGEGCFRFASGTPTIQVTNCYPAVLERFLAQFGGRIARSDGGHTSTYPDRLLRPHREKRPHRPQWRWECTGPTARRVCRDLIPFLHEKHEQAHILSTIHLFPVRSAKRAALVEKLTQLKRVSYESY